MSRLDAIKARFARARERFPLLDHAVHTQQQYTAVNGSMLAGGVTYFAFLSFFPILALAFFAVGYATTIYPDSAANLERAINEVLPGMIGDDEGQISLSTFTDSAGTVGLIGVLGLLYAGLGWLSAMRDALVLMFDVEKGAQPNFIVGKLRDLMTLLLVGVILVLSVSVSGVVTGFSRDLLELVGLGTELAPLLRLLSVALGMGANMLLFVALFRLLARPEQPPRSLWGGALLGAIGFELLKWASSFLISQTKSQPAFQAFGIALVLLVWINYSNRVVMYAAAWACSDRTARAARAAAEAAEAAEDTAGPTSAAGTEAAQPRGLLSRARDPAPAASGGPARPVPTGADAKNPPAALAAALVLALYLRARGRPRD